MREIEKMELYVKRDFGDQISATFEFIKLNIGRIVKNYLIFGAPFILLGCLVLK